MTKSVNDDLKLFALKATRTLGESIAENMGITLSQHEERDFEDGEHKTRALENIRNCDVYVIQSIYGDDEQSVNDKLCRLLFFIGSLRDAGAGKVTAITPYLCYMRKDRKTKPRDPVTTRYVGSLFGALKTYRILTVDVHNLQAYQNGFDCHAEHLEAQILFTDYFARLVDDEEVAIMSPDAGGVKRAEQFRQRMERRLQQKKIPLIFLEKQRSKGIVSGDMVVGEIEGKTVIIIDDLISTGTTLARAAKACVERNAKKVYAAATHGAFLGKASDVLKERALEEVVITNSIPPFRLSSKILKKVQILDMSPLLAEAIQRLHNGGSLVDLMDPIDK